MPRPNIRPWRDQAELLTVRKLLFPATDTNNPETLFRSQRLGVNIVSVYTAVSLYMCHTCALLGPQVLSVLAFAHPMVLSFFPTVTVLVVAADLHVLLLPQTRGITTGGKCSRLRFPGQHMETPVPRPTLCRFHCSTCRCTASAQRRTAFDIYYSGNLLNRFRTLCHRYLRYGAK